MGNVLSQFWKPERGEKGPSDGSRGSNQEESTSSKPSTKRKGSSPSVNIPTTLPKEESYTPRKSGSYTSPNPGSYTSLHPRSYTPPKSGTGGIHSHSRRSWDDLLSTVDEDVLLRDPELADFDDGMKQRTEKVLDKLEQGMNSGGLELSSLREVTSGLLDMDEQVAKIIVDCDLDLWANDEMKRLVTQYFDHSLRTLNFFDYLEKSVQQAQDSLMMYIGSAINYIPDGRDPDEAECKQILLLLDLFVKENNPFSSEFTKLFSEVCAQQKRLKERLDYQKKRYHRRDRNVGMVRKVTTVILTATSVSLVICAAVAMAIAAPMAGNLSASAAASLPFETSQGWLRNLWKKYEQRVKVRRDFLDSSVWSVWSSIQDLETINVEVSRLNGEIDGILRNIRFGQERGDSRAVQQTVKVIQRKQDNFGQELAELKSHISDCVRRINSHRGFVLERILGDPKRESQRGRHVRHAST